MIKNKNLLNNINELIFIIIVTSILILLVILYRKNFMPIETFAGNKFPEYKLNQSLLRIIKLLNLYEINDWFISYGTLLGIVRNNSCINNDDDIDIIIDAKYRTRIIQLIDNHKFKYILNNKIIIKVELEENTPTIDFYLSNVNDKGDFYDKQNNVIWRNSKPFKIKKWKDINLVLPNDYEIKLANRYGPEWRIPKDTKKIKYKKII